MKAIAVCCPECDRRIDSFRITANENRTLTLHATCHACRIVAQLTVSYDDFADLARGKEVALRPAGDAAYVM